MPLSDLDFFKAIYCIYSIKNPRCFQIYKSYLGPDSNIYLETVVKQGSSLKFSRKER